MKILIVDDETTIADIFAETFEDEGLNSFAVYSGNQAIKFIQENSDLKIILSDIRMPDGDGLSIVNYVSSMPKDDRPLIMFMTGHSEYSSEELVSKGALKVFQKPIDFNAVVEEIINQVKTNS